MRASLTDPIHFAFLGATFLLGLTVALQVPTLSLFLAEEVRARPVMVGLFTSFNAVMAIVVGHWLGKRSDVRGDRRRLVLQCCFAGVALSVLFAWTRNYWLLVVLVAVIIHDPEKVLWLTCLPHKYMGVARVMPNAGLT